MFPSLDTLRRLKFIDLSVPISPTTAEPLPPRIHYISHQCAARDLAGICTQLVNQNRSDKTAVIPESAFQDGLGLANEDLEVDSHAGTHMDAPWHFGPLSEGEPAKTIDKVPLEWCWGPGVVLDLRHKKAGETITPEDLRQALGDIHYRLRPGDIVLLMTGADKRFTESDYFSAHPGMGRDATLWLLDRGIKVIGIDGWGFDRPVVPMLEDYVRTGDRSYLLPAHMVGREREYCHLEKLANLDHIPRPYGFQVACFPVKIERGSAGWVRAVALVEEDPA